MKENRIERELLELYLSNSDIIGEGFPTFVNRARSDAMELLNVVGLPDAHTEAYRQTPIQPLYDQEAEKYFIAPAASENCFENRLPLDGSCQHFCGGFCVDNQLLISKDNGVVYGSIAVAAQRYPELLERYYNTLAGSAGSDGVTALNTLFMQDGFFLYIPVNVVVEKPICAVYGYEATEAALAFSRALVIVERGAQVELIFDNQGNPQENVLSNQVSEIFCEEGAQVKWTHIQRCGEHVSLLSSTYVSQRRDSHFESIVTTLDGALVRNNYRVQLFEAGAESHAYGIAISGYGQHIDNYTNIEHLAPDCSSFEQYKGVASGDGVVGFNGRVYVAPDAQRTQAYQQNNNLQMSDEAHIYSKPQLEIYADDVKCSHGATVGQLDPEAIFYMRQRGLSEKEARKLQLYGFVNEIVGKLPQNSLIEFLDEVALTKIHKL